MPEISDLLSDGTTALFALAPNGQIASVNPAACELLGCSAEAVVGRSLRDLVELNDRPLREGVSVWTDGLQRVASDVEQGLDQLIRISREKRQAGIVVTEELHRIASLACNQRHDPFKYLVHIHVLPLRTAHGTEQTVGQRSQTIRFADDDSRVLTQVGRGKFALEQLGSATKPAQRIPNLVRQLTDHAPTGISLGDQGVLSVNLAPLGSIGKFDDHAAPRAAGR